MGVIADLLKEIPSAARYKFELEDIETENARLQAENQQLRELLDAARTEIAELRPDALQEEAERVLLFIAKDEHTATPAIMQKLGLSKPSVDMHLEDLLSSRFIGCDYGMSEETTYYVVQGGRKYLHAKGKL